ncbi:hypothetical protein [Kolteria novifilia]|uniref:hypothetical protein n=1 Tax=Kolteria novifilia TaxID=2527975 RepID=UPI003AF3EC57
MRNRCRLPHLPSSLYLAGGSNNGSSLSTVDAYDRIRCSCNPSSPRNGVLTGPTRLSMYGVRCLSGSTC